MYLTDRSKVIPIFVKALWYAKNNARQPRARRRNERRNDLNNIISAWIHTETINNTCTIS